MTHRPEITGQRGASAGRVKRSSGPVPQLAFTIKTFCLAHAISEGLYFKMKQLGLAPREMKIGKLVLISHEAAHEWRRQREAAAAAASPRLVRRPQASQPVESHTVGGET